ncbi:MAG TPA: NADH-quinone oxidoreductase subunit J [Bellilinea sp.]|uniref:NADH-quinone oxidoreductase subunit J n=1 Tax=uncultured Chloroflexi bacterium Rifle_16ft_4_minimus_640 TaxID=1665080 RepID=A0A0H4TUN9_9CHLR|nr:putative NADH-quinone oxidoreductase subunit J, NADH-quinone oxidoreductase subunit J [uncultured Chloroflexi bacterium Rifle_16ft_4_minimus_640]
MSGLQVVFLIVAIVTLFSGLMVVASRKMMHSALWLILSLLGVAILFGTLQAGFFAIVQILVYIGAISILIIFTLMLTRRVMDDDHPGVIKGWWLPALMAVILFGLLAGFMATWDNFQAMLNELPANPENLAGFGAALVDPAGYVIPFEVASVLLLAALVGAIYIAAERKEKAG